MHPLMCCPMTASGNKCVCFCEIMFVWKFECHLACNTRWLMYGCFQMVSHANISLGRQWVWLALAAGGIMRSPSGLSLDRGNNGMSQWDVLVNGFLLTFQVIVECSCHCWQQWAAWSFLVTREDVTASCRTEKWAWLCLYAWLVVRLFMSVCQQVRVSFNEFVPKRKGCPLILLVFCVWGLVLVFVKAWFM